jgi:MSHA biogenesis protein MshE
LRQDPDVILVGEMRDHETVEVGLRAAMTGHMVLSTLHTNDAISTPMRLLDMGAPRYMVSMSLHLVLAQRLVRMNCESCMREYELLPSESEWMRQELGDEINGHSYRKGVGCSQCNNTGYLGRTGVYEMLEMTRPVVEAANSGESADFLQVARRQMHGHTLRRHAATLVGQGRTTVEEAMKVSTALED